MPSDGTYPDADATEVVSAVLDGRLARTDATELLRRPLPSTARQFLRHAEVEELAELIEGAQSIERARALTELTAAAAEPLGKDEVRGSVLGVGAVRLLDLGAPEQALVLFDEARELLPADITGLDAWKFRLRTLCRLDRRAEFERDLPAFLAAAERLGSSVDLCTVLHDRAVLAARAGDTAQALESVREARRIRATVAAEDDGHAESPASFALQHAYVARQSGRFEEALGALEDMRDLALAAGHRPAAAWALSELGVTWDLLGEHARAEEFLAKAATEAELIGRHTWADHWRHRTPDQPRHDGNENERPTSWHRAASLMLRTPDRAAEAVPLLRKAIAEARADHHPDVEADARTQLAAALVRCGQPQQAQLAMRAAIATTRRSGDLLREVRYVTNLAHLLVFEDEPEEAGKEIESAIERGEQLRARAATVELSQNVAIALARAYDIAILIAAALYRGGLDSGQEEGIALARRQPDVLLALGQRARAATMTQALRAGLITEEHADSAPALVPAMLELRAGEAAVQLAAARGENLSAAISQRDRAAGRLQDTAAAAGVSLTVGADPVPTDQLAAALAPDEVLVDLLTVPEGVVVTCLAPDGRSAVELLVWEESDRRRMRQRLQRTYRERLRAHPDDLAETRLLAEAALDDLDGVLLTPVADTVRQLVGAAGWPRRILVSPENELFHLPYWRLSAHLGGCTVSILPTPGALPLLRARRRDGRRPWISVSDPSGELRHAARDLAPELGYRPCAPDAAALLSTLPAAGRVHFACHGEFDAHNAHLSGLHVRPAPSSPDPAADPLGLPRDADPEARDLFTVAQISGRLYLPHCTLVVLSACTSGLPRVHPASEFTSLPGAFLMSGARNVVASVWLADDGAAALFMRAFYAELTDSPSAALAAARRRLATTSRAEAAEALGTDDLPPFDPPFAESVYTDCFQHYGVD
ncbi:CHAT domain-containing protein [Streptomyces sp. NPDC086777]|uniref:CHAT domain-containing protein n=1 Tax=Streptomyces sp. NPDC086777 TaxID=3154866 RepID=UPI00344E8B53